MFEFWQKRLLRFNIDMNGLFMVGQTSKSGHGLTDRERPFKEKNYLFLINELTIRKCYCCILRTHVAVTIGLCEYNKYFRLIMLWRIIFYKTYYFVIHRHSWLKQELCYTKNVKLISFICTLYHEWLNVFAQI